MSRSVLRAYPLPGCFFGSGPYAIHQGILHGKVGIWTGTFSEQVGVDIAAVARSSMESAVMFSPLKAHDFRGVMRPVFKALDDIVTGTIAPQEAMDPAQQQAESLGH